MYALLSNQPLQVVWQTSSTEGQGEFASFVNGIVLSLDDKVGEGIDEFTVVGERVEDGRSRGLGRHCYVCVFELFCVYIQGCVCSQGSSVVGN